MRKLLLVVLLLAALPGGAALVEHLRNRALEAEIERLSALLDADLAALCAETDERVRLPGPVPEESAFELYRRAVEAENAGEAAEKFDLLLRAARAERIGDRSLYWKQGASKILSRDWVRELERRAKEREEDGDPGSALRVGLVLRLLAEDLRRGGSSIDRGAADGMRGQALKILWRSAAWVGEQDRAMAAQVFQGLLGKPESLRDALRGDVLITQVLLQFRTRHYEVLQRPRNRREGILDEIRSLFREEGISRRELVALWRRIRELGAALDVDPDRLPSFEVDHHLLRIFLDDLKEKAESFRTKEQDRLRAEREFLDWLLREGGR